MQPEEVSKADVSILRRGMRQDGQMDGQTVGLVSFGGTKMARDRSWRSLQTLVIGVHRSSTSHILVIRTGV